MSFVKSQKCQYRDLWPRTWAHPWCRPTWDHRGRISSQSSHLAAKRSSFHDISKVPYQATFDLDLEHTQNADPAGNHRVQVWLRSSHLPARRSDLHKCLQMDGQTSHAIRWHISSFHLEMSLSGSVTFQKSKWHIIWGRSNNKNTILKKHTGTEGRILDMAQVELRVMLYVLIGLYSRDCSLHENSERTAADNMHTAQSPQHQSHQFSTLTKPSSQEILTSQLHRLQIIAIYEGHSINKLQNGVILLIFQAWKNWNIRPVRNLILNISYICYYNDVTVMSFINIKCSHIAVVSTLKRTVLCYLFSVGTRTWSKCNSLWDASSVCWQVFYETNNTCLL